jgi:probable HAF family extracellular repeat protein
MIGLGQAPGAIATGASKVSADGSVIVGANQFKPGSSPDSEAFRWTENDGMVGLGDLTGGPRYSSAFDVSANGSVIVGTSLDQDGPAAFYWTASTGMLNLQDLLVTLGADNLDDWVLLEARGVSADGVIVAGRGIHNGREEAWVATIPEPSTLGLAVVAGLGVLAVCFRRKPFRIGR